MTIRNTTRWASLLVPAALVVLTTGCQQRMAKQPSIHKPLEPSAFFADGRSARPVVAGTVVSAQAPGHANAVPEITNPALLTGRTGKAGAASSADRAAALVGLGAVGGMEALPVLAGSERTARPAGDLGYVTTYPIRIDRAAVQRGRQRFNIYCLPCHGETGRGDGKIVERGYLPPPSYITDESRGLKTLGYNVLLRDAPVGYFFEVITEGYGAMPSYSEQVPPEDRWKIAAYIRALQLAQHARLADLPAPQRDAVRKELENQP